MAHTELDLRERRAIEDMLNAKVPVGKIAAEIGRHRSTVYREIRRNHFTDEELPYLSGYYGMNAQKYASNRRARRRKLIRLDDLRAHVIDRLIEGWTPEQIAGRLGYGGQPARVSHDDLCLRLQPRRPIRTTGASSAQSSQETAAALCQTRPRSSFFGGSVHSPATGAREDAR